MKGGGCSVLWVFGVLAACQGTTGTITLELTTSPGSTVLDGVDRLRVTITQPHAVFETIRSANGFDLAFDLEATGGAGALVLEGFDTTGNLVATGMSPPFPVAPLQAKIVIFVAPPMSIEAAPMALAPARELPSTGTLSYGAVLAGGRDPTTMATSDALTIYNAYVHTLTQGLPMPGPRIGAGLAVGTNDGVYLFGGRDAGGTATGSLWRFDTRVSPAGAYSVIADAPSYARADDRLVPIGTDRFLVTGRPVILVDPLGVTARTEITSLGPSGAGLVGSDSMPAAIFADDNGVVRFRDADAFTTLATIPRPGARTVALPDHTAIVVGGSLDALRVDPATGTVTTLAGFLPVGCPRPETAATTRHLLVGCGTETYVYDARTLELVATIATSGSSMTPLPNDQILMMRGSELALFTPPPPQP